MCRPVSDYPAIVKAEHSVNCLILGVFFFPGQLNSFYTKRGKQTCILRNNPAVYPSVKATKNKMISMLKYCIGLFQNFIKWITFSYNKGAWGRKVTVSQQSKSEALSTSHLLHGPMWVSSECLQSAAFRRWHGTYPCCRWWNMNMKRHKACLFLQHSSHTELESKGQWAAKKSNHRPVWPCFPTTDTGLKRLNSKG